MAWAHFWMALTLWFMPQFTTRVWPRLPTRGRVGAIAVLALIVLTPTVFAQWRAATWEFPRETQIDNAAFNRAGVSVVPGSLALLSTGTDARYHFTLRIGPRDYRNWFKQMRSLDASSIQITAKLSRNGQIIAWCDTSVDRLPSANAVTLPENFAAVMKSVTYTDVPVTCNGPGAQAQSLSGSPQVNLDWAAQMTLIGGREQQSRRFSGNQTVAMSFT